MNGFSRGEIAGMPSRPEKALLFDIDGTLADTDALHLQAFNQVFGPPRSSLRPRPRQQGTDGVFQCVDQRAVPAG
jgi:hypothetical protein